MNGSYERKLHQTGEIEIDGTIHSGKDRVRVRENSAEKNANIRYH